MIRFYADSADLDQVLPLVSDGLVYGVTTNPTILARDGWTYDTLPRLVHHLEDAGAREIFVQTWGRSYQEMHDNIRRALSFSDRVVAKVPATRNGFHLAAVLTREKRPVLLTAVYSLAQAVAAGSVGISYIAPYLGRLNDHGRDGDTLVPAMQAALADSPTKVLVASVRTPEALAHMVANGVTYITAAPAVLEAAFLDELTEAATAGFEADWNGGYPQPAAQ